MGFLLKTLGGPFGTYVLIAVAVVFLAMGGTISWLWGERTDLLVKNGQLTAQYETAKSANESNIKVINELEASNADWAARFQLNEEKLRDASKNLAWFVGEIERLNRSLTLAGERDRANPDCQKVLKVTLTACPALNDGLLEYARRRDSYRN